MVINDVVKRRIERIEESLRRLEEIKTLNLDTFLSDWKAQDVALRNFQVVIEACLDIGNHMIASFGWVSPESYIKIVEILGDKKVIPSNFIDIMKDLVKFRNIIVHEYLYIDLKKVYAKLKQINEIRKFIRYIIEFFERKKES